MVTTKLEEGWKARGCRRHASNSKQKVKERSLDDMKSITVVFAHLHGWLVKPESQK